MGKLVDIGRVLRNRIAPELNHLYTTSPFNLSAGVVDAGWFCREHALHVFVIARAMGFLADLRKGHFVIKRSDELIMQSLTSGGDHMWCSVDNCVPVDLSMNFSRLHGFQQLDLPIWGAGKNGPYVIQYTASRGDAIDTIVSPTVVFMESEIITESPANLLRNPYRLLHPPNPSDPMNWDAIYGPDIYSRITLHCLSLVTGDANPTEGRLSASNSIQWIFESYPNAIETLLSGFQGIE